MGERDHPGILERRARRAEQVRLRLDPAELRRFDETVEERGDLGAALGAGAVVILAPDDRRTSALKFSRRPQPEFVVWCRHQPRWSGM